MAHRLSRDLCKPKAGLIFHVGGHEYKLGGKVGDGAAGLVRRATRRTGNRLRAIKFLAPDPKYIEVSAFDDVAARFRSVDSVAAARKLLHEQSRLASREEDLILLLKETAPDGVQALRDVLSETEEAAASAHERRDELRSRCRPARRRSGC